MRTSATCFGPQPGLKLPEARDLRREPAMRPERSPRAHRAGICDRAAATLATPLLNERERLVIRLARTDPRSSLKGRPGLFARLLGLPRSSLSLADARLEALRRYAILLRLDGRELPTAERQAVSEAGYDAVRRALIASLVADARP